MNPVSPTDEERIARRYPKRTVWDYLIYGGVAIGVGAVIVSALLSGLVRSNPPAQATIRAFEVLSPNQVTVDLLLQRTDPTKPAECKVFAQAASYEQVGEKLVTLPPSPEHVSSHIVTLATTKQAAAVDVQGCRLAQ